MIGYLATLVHTFFMAWLLTLSILALFLLSGRLFAGALGSRGLRILDVTSAAASAIAGTAMWTVVFGLLSRMGVSAPRIAMTGLALCLTMAAAVWWRRAWSVLRPRGPALPWVTAALLVGVAAALALLPLARREAFLIGNDTFTYCALADWLQDHGFGDAAVAAPHAVVDAIPRLYQYRGFPLGASYVLALVGAAVRAPTTLLVYPATSAFGVVLSVCGIWVAGRWIFGLRGVSLALGCLAYAVLPHPGYWAHHNGFLSQTLAVPFLLLGLGALARIGRHRQAELAMLIAVSAAFLAIVYLPFLPLLAGAAIVQALPRARAESREARLLRPRFVGRAFLLFVLFIGFDLTGIGRGLVVLGGASAGMNVPLAPYELLVFILGTRVYLGGNVFLDGWPILVPVLSGVLAVLFCLGIVVARRRAAWPLLSAFALLAGLVVYQTLFVDDPWTGHRGHTWNIFKVVQWTFPLVILVVAAGAGWLHGRVRSAWPLTLNALLMVAVLPVHWTWGAFLGDGMARLIGSVHPLAEVAGLKRRFQDLPSGELLLLGRPASNSPWLGAYTALLAYPRPVLADWEDSASINVDPRTSERYRDHLDRLPDSGDIVLTAGFVSRADPSRALLGGGFSRLLSLDRPRLVQLVDPTQGPEVGPPFGVGSERTKLVFFSPTAGDETLALECRLLTGGMPAFLVVQQAGPAIGGPSFRKALRSSRGYEVRLDGAGVSTLPIRLERGLNTVVLTASRGAGRESGVGRLVVVDFLSLSPRR